MSLVVDFVLLGGTNSVLVIWGLILYSVYRQILPCKKSKCFLYRIIYIAKQVFYKALAHQSRLSVIPY